MKWSRQTYNMVVTILAEELYILPLILVDAQTDAAHYIKGIMVDTVDCTLERFVKVFQEDNPNFSETRFREAFVKRGREVVARVMEMQKINHGLELENPSDTIEDRLDKLVREVYDRWDVGNNVDEWPESYTEE